MRGKKSDPEFVSTFISECVQQGITSTEDIVAAAKYDIQNIDDKIKEVETLKILRSKLLDVISALDRPVLKVEEAKLLPFFKIENPQTCKNICYHIVDLSPDSKYSVVGIKDPEIIFCIKQLIEHKVIARDNNFVIPGEKFQEYIDFLLQEAE